MGSHVKSNQALVVREIMDSLRRIVQTLRVSSRHAEAKVGLSGAQLFVLSKLRGVDPISVNDLAERTATHQSSVSVVVGRLVKRGLVRRTLSKKDARCKMLELTTEGRSVLRSAPDAAQEKLIAGLQRMKSTHRTTLANSLALWAKQISEESSPVMMFEEQPPTRGGSRG